MMIMIKNGARVMLGTCCGRNWGIFDGDFFLNLEVFFRKIQLNCQKN